jgi:hypothetical protein
MSEYIYDPRHTFLARCWWQGAAGHIEPGAWEQAKQHLAAIWVQTGSTGIRNEWDRYLMAEAEGVLEKHLDPSDYPTPEIRFYELFWFGAYTNGGKGRNEKFYYEVRPADRIGTVSRWALDYNSSFLSGYVGVWEAAEAQGTHRKPEGARLWTVDGLPGEDMKKGDRLYNLQLLTPGGEKILRYQKNGAFSFNTLSGEPGHIAMEILSIPHHFGEV